MTDIGAIAGELYGLDPADFTAARNARAKEAKDRATARRIKTLRKPSTAAWTVNRLVREHPDEIGDLLDLGAALRRAQDELAGDDLRALDEQRHGVLAAVGKQAGAVARAGGHALTDQISQQVDSTLRAAMADPGAAAAVRSGLLTKELQATGFGPADLAGAVALPEVLDGGQEGTRAAPAKGRGTKGAGKESATRRRRRERAEREAQHAQQVADQAAEELDRANQDLDDLDHGRDELADRIGELTRRLQQARAEDQSLATRQRQARRRRDTAGKKARDASREAARARARLARLD